MADKQEIMLEEVLEKLGQKDPTKEAVFGSPEWILLEKHIKDKNFEHDDRLDALKKDAETNKAANALQIGKELYDFTRERTAKTFYKKQRIHNRGAQASRRKIEAELAALKELLNERASTIIQRGGFGPEGYQEPTPTVIVKTVGEPLALDSFILIKLPAIMLKPHIHLLLYYRMYEG